MELTPAVYSGLLVRGTLLAIRINTPLMIPHAPPPAIARPRISTGELGLIPQRREPSSKMPMDMRKTHLAG